MKNKILSVAEILLSVLTFPLWFIKMFADVGYLPDREGGIVKVEFRHSMYENVCDGASSFIAYVAMSIVIVSVILNIVNVKSDNKKLYIVGNIVFVVAMGLFIILLLYAATLARGY